MKPYPLWEKILVSAFIVFHLGCAAVASLPDSRARKLLMRPIVSAYLTTNFQWQNWDLFGPDPMRANQYLGATVLLADGRSIESDFPRLARMNVWEAWAQWRYRRMQYVVLNRETPVYRKEIARYVARKARSSGQRPVRVALYQYRSPMPRHDRPEAEIGPRPVDYSTLLRERAVYEKTLLFDYEVKPEDLR